MASYIGSTLNSSTRTSSNSSTRVCPDCGGLECLCRPRFFAGQLLTEQEFNRLDRYIVEKNKLHNRYLHGWGVVCGLDVVCDGCSGGVIVKTGYALSPCGEDIIVCSDASVDVCSLINQCKKKTQPDCGATNTNDGCAEATQEWVLAICYSETASRGVMPLRGGSSSSGGCGCGCGGNSGNKSSSGGCGCGGSSGSKSGASSTSTSSSTSSSGGCGCGQKSSSSASKCAPPLQCEPTVLCEGYSFCVYPAPNKTIVRGDQAAANTKQGAMAARFTACLQNLTDNLPEVPSSNVTKQDLHDWVYAMKVALQAYIRDNPIYDCQLGQKIGQVICPDISFANAKFKAAFTEAEEQLLLIVLELMLACMCRALQPPCPDPVMDDCIPLAVITVQNKDTCKVTSICNWTTLRKYVTTFPNMEYWLSILPYGRLLREALENFCCKAIAQFTPRATHVIVDNPPVDEKAKAKTETVANAEEVTTTDGISMSSGSAATAFRASAQTITRSKTFMQMALKTLSTYQTSMTAQDLTLGILGGGDSEKDPYLTTAQSDNLMQFLLMDQMAKPALRTMIPSNLDVGNLKTLTNLANMFTGATASTESAKKTAHTAATASSDLEARLKALSDTVQKQQATIDKLSEQLRPTASARKTTARTARKESTAKHTTPKKKNG